MFCWPCISVHPCNENQLNALFILSLYRHSTSACFGHICSPSSGGILYIYNKWYVLCILFDRLMAGQQTVKQVEVDWRSKLRINSASSWFSLHGDSPLFRPKGRCHDNTKMDLHELKVCRCGFYSTVSWYESRSGLLRTQ